MHIHRIQIHIKQMHSKTSQNTKNAIHRIGMMNGWGFALSPPHSMFCLFCLFFVQCFEFITLISKCNSWLTICFAVVCVELTTYCAPVSANIFAILAHIPICFITYSCFLHNVSSFVLVLVRYSFSSNMSVLTSLCMVMSQ